MPDRMPYEDVADWFESYEEGMSDKLPWSMGYLEFYPCDICATGAHCPNHKPCDICKSAIPGDRYPYHWSTWTDLETHYHMDVCKLCYNYLAYKYVPESY